MITARGELSFPAGSTIAPWDAKTMFYCDEAIVDHTLDPARGERKITTPEELQQVLELSEQNDAKMRIWIREGLEDTVKQLMD